MTEHQNFQRPQTAEDTRRGLAAISSTPVWPCNELRQHGMWRVNEFTSLCSLHNAGLFLSVQEEDDLYSGYEAEGPLAVRNVCATSTCKQAMSVTSV